MSVVAIKRFHREQRLLMELRFMCRTGGRKAESVAVLRAAGVSVHAPIKMQHERQQG